MFSFFQPRYVKYGHAVAKNAHKLLAYKRDLLSEMEVASLKNNIEDLEKAIRARDAKAVTATIEELETQWSDLLPPVKDAAWRENCEVFLVAIIIAVGVRTYFLQPFTIPTGSMQPTLNGIIGYDTKNSDQPPPSLPKQIFDFVWTGKNYINVVARADDRIANLEERKVLRFFIFTTIRMASGDTYSVYSPLSTLEHYFGVLPHAVNRGDVIARGYVGAGDHVFVDKFTYNFRAPHRGEVFVFNTGGDPPIPTQENEAHPGSPSQFYIKRLGGLPGDQLRIAAPDLFVNGERAKGVGFERVMSMRDGYNGYGNIRMNFKHLRDPNDTLQVPEKSYFALGDNSYNSSDSRFWGFVPQQNIMGRAVVVYWPFSPHGGLIR